MKTKSFLYLITPILVFVTACTGGNNKDVCFDFSAMKPIKGEIIPMEIPLLAPRSIYIIEDKLFVIDKYDGRLIESGDCYQLAKCIEQMLTTKHNYGEKAREMVYRTFDQSKQASKLLDLYNIATH